MACWDNGSFFLLERNGTGLLGATGGSVAIVTGGAPTENAWNHVAMVRSATTLKMYLNGTNTGTTTDSNVIDTVTTLLLIGASQTSASPNKLYSGDIADVAIWTRALSGTELSNLAALTHRPGDMATSLLGWWKLDGSGSTEADSAGSNTLTVTGATTATDPPYVSAAASGIVQQGPRMPQAILAR